MDVYKLDFAKKTVTYYKSKTLDIYYINREAEVEKLHPDLLAVTQAYDNNKLAELAVQHLSVEDLEPYLFKKFADDERDALILRLNAILQCKMSKEDIEQLPGRYPQVRSRSESEINCMSDEEYDAYCEAIDKFDAIYWPISTHVRPKRQQMDQTIMSQNEMIDSFVARRNVDPNTFRPVTAVN